MTSQERFNAAVNIIKCLPKDGPFQPSHDMMLKFYGLYKQAVEGPCRDPKPAFYEVVKGYKWRAWNSLGDMPKTEAMDSYVEELKKIIETIPYTQDVANFIDALGPFYEFIDIPALKPKNNNNVKGLEDSPPFRANGQHEAIMMSNGYKGKINGNACSDLDSGSEEGQSSSQGSSPELVSVGSNNFTVPLSQDQEAEEVEDEEEEELVVMEVHNAAENTTTHTLTLSPKVYSDSDSDEEYSEPAEMNIDFSVIGNKTYQQTGQPVLPSQQSAESQFTAKQSILSEVLDTPTRSTDTPVEAIVFGGGDQSHPGGLQNTPRQCQGALYSGSFCPPGEGRNLATPMQSGNLLRSSGSGGGAGGGGGRRGSYSSISEDVNAQLVILLRRLQNDMENVLHRLNTLETLTVTQHHSTHCRHCQVDNGSPAPVRTERSWWPFPELSPRSTFFLLIWPLILHGGIKLLLLLRSRRRKN